MALTFYTNPMSRGRIARWMLEEVGEPYDTQLLEYGTTMKAPGYLAVNPMGKVPALDHDGRIVTECAAVCAYLAEAFPAAGLMPEDRAAFYRWMFFAAGPIEAAVTNKALAVSVPPERRGMVGYGSLEAVTDALEAHLTAHSHFCDDRFTVVDVVAGSQIGYGMRYGTIEPRPALAAYWERISARPAHARAAAIDDALLPKRE
jgi:glutathione S-transferase